VRISWLARPYNPVVLQRLRCIVRGLATNLDNVTLIRAVASAVGRLKMKNKSLRVIEVIPH
jgi:hypothetical protein